MKFKQDIKEFISSKSNWLGVSAVLSGAIGYQTKALQPIEAINMIGGGLALLFVHDTIAGSK
jgi:hypothetical protein